MNPRSNTCLPSIIQIRRTGSLFSKNNCGNVKKEKLHEEKIPEDSKRFDRVLWFGYHASKAIVNKYKR